MQSFFLHFHNILLMLVENRLKAEIQGLGAAIAQEGADPGPSLAVLKVIEEEKLMHNVHRLVGKIMHSKFTISSYNWYVWYLMNVRLLSILSIILILLLFCHCFIFQGWSSFGSALVGSWQSEETSWPPYWQRTHGWSFFQVNF